MHTKKGFTIIELLIAIAIMVVIIGIVLVNYRVGQRQQTLQAEAQKLASTLRQAQNMALAGETYNCGSGNESQNYGVYLCIIGNNYKLFVDCDKGGDCDTSEITNHFLETTILPDNIAMSFPGAGGALFNCFVFECPHGSLSNEYTSESIKLTLEDYEKTVSINPATGQISVE